MSVDVTKIKDKLKDFITDRFLAGDIVDNFNDETLLLDEQIIDSSGILVLIMHIEKTYNIRIDDDELVPENFNSLNMLGRLVEQKLA